jgi:single-strand DNA-binding protein
MKKSQSFEIQGKLYKVFPSENKSGSFQARQFVIEVESGQYSQFVKFQLTQDRCDLIDSYSEGEEIQVSFDLRGREWDGKYFTNLNAWRLNRPSSTEKTDSPKPTVQDEVLDTSDSEKNFAEQFDDLPF